MSRSYLLADVLAAMKNASLVRKDTVVVPYSSFVMGIMNILKEQGYINDCEKIDEGNNKSSMKITLKYNDKKSAIIDMQIVSKPSRRVYVAKNDVPWVLRGRGVAIVSTSNGLYTDKEARKAGVGGELVMKAW